MEILVEFVVVVEVVLIVVVVVLEGFVGMFVEINVVVVVVGSLHTAVLLTILVIDSRTPASM